MAVHEVAVGPLILACVFCGIVCVVLLLVLTGSWKWCPCCQYNINWLAIYDDEYYLEYQKDPMELRRKLEPWQFEFAGVDVSGWMPGVDPNFSWSGWDLPVQKKAQPDIWKPHAGIVLSDDAYGAVVFRENFAEIQWARLAEAHGPRDEVHMAKVAGIKPYGAPYGSYKRVNPSVLA